MLTRRREQIIVFLGLVALNLGFGVMLSRYWKDYRANTQWIYTRKSIEPETTGGLSQAPVAAQNFAVIVDRTMFRPERTNEVATEKIEKLPELPLLYGTMNLGDGMFAMMAPGEQANGLSKPVHLGEEIGGYKLVSIANSQVVVGWGEKRFTVNVWESARKVPRIVDKSGPPSRSAESSPPTGARSVTTATSSSASTAPVVVGGSKQKTGFVGFNAPSGASADAPVGTVIGGKRKVQYMTLYGPSYRWENVEAPKDTTPQQNPPKEK